MISSYKKITRGYGPLVKVLAKKRARMADKLIKNGLRSGKILDLGCGRTPYFLLHTLFSEKYGLDIDSEDKFSEIKIGYFNFDKKEKIPFEENYFSVVTMLAVFEHISINNLEYLLREIKRILIDKGILIITTPCPHTDILLLLLAKIKLVSSIEVDDHKGSYYPSKVKSHLIRSGFDGQKITSGFFEANF